MLKRGTQKRNLTSSGWKSYISSNSLPLRPCLQIAEISFIRVCQRVFGKIGKRFAMCEESEETTSVKLKKMKHLKTEDVKIDPTIISPLDLINSLICHRVFGKIGRSTTMFKEYKCWLNKTCMHIWHKKIKCY